MRRTAIVVVLTVLLAAVAYRGASAHDRASEVRERIVSQRVVSVSDRLYCGMSRISGAPVTEAETEAFITEIVEPRFPDGFTWWYARGGWAGGREQTLVIEIGRPNDSQSEERIEEIGREYARRFAQHSVFRIKTPAHLESITP
jgi:hypothetical protein